MPHFSQQQPPADDPLGPLAEAVQRGDLAATRKLVAVLLPVQLRVVRQVLGVQHPDVEDVLQESAFALLEALAGFRGDSGLRHFAARVALFTAMNARRRVKLRERLVPSMAHDACDDFVSDMASPSAEFLASRRRRALGDLLDELPRAQAEALALHCVLGYTIAETAEAVGAPPNTVRGRLNTAKLALRKRLSEDATLNELLVELERGAS
jgi:RNA polymerase sigma-70 factor, ECF subfamily